MVVLKKFLFLVFKGNGNKGKNNVGFLNTNNANMIKENYL
jgi:hypothetical protein